MNKEGIPNEERSVRWVQWSTHLGHSSSFFRSETMSSGSLSFPLFLYVTLKTISSLTARELYPDTGLLETLHLYEPQCKTKSHLDLLSKRVSGFSWLF